MENRFCISERVEGQRDDDGPEPGCSKAISSHLCLKNWHHDAAVCLIDDLRGCGDGGGVLVDRVCVSVSRHNPREGEKNKKGEKSALAEAFFFPL